MTLNPINTPSFGPPGVGLADKLNTMVQQVNATRGMSFGPGFEVLQTPDGYTVNLDRSLFRRLAAREVKAQVTSWEAVSGQDTIWEYTMDAVGVAFDSDRLRPVATVLDGDLAFRFTAYNWTEINNVAQGTGVQGNSVDESAADYAATSMTIQPVGGGTGGTPGNNVIRPCTEFVGADGTSFWMFDYQNAVDGAC